MTNKTVKTLTASELAKKWNLSLAEVQKLITQGSAVEKEHTKNIKDAKEIARDHLKERPDYYKKLKKVEQVAEDNDLKGSCWKGYTAKGLKKKGNRMVPNCVPVSEQGSPANPARYTERPMYEKNLREFDTSSMPMSRNVIDKRPGLTSMQGLRNTVDKFNQSMSKSSSGSVINAVGSTISSIANTNKSSGLEGASGNKISSISKAAPASSSSPSMASYGGATPTKVTSTSTPETSSDSTPAARPAGRTFSIDSTGKISKSQIEKNIDSRTPGTPDNWNPRDIFKEEKKRIDEISAELVGKVHNKKYLEKGKAPSELVARFVKKKWLESQVGKMKDKKKDKIDEDAATIDAMQHMNSPRMERPGYTRQAPARQFNRSIPNVRTNMGAQQPPMRAGVQVQRAAPMRPISARMNTSQGGSMTAQVQTQRAAPMRPVTTSPSSGAGRGPALNAKPTVTRGMEASKFSIQKGMAAAGKEAGEKAASKIIPAAAEKVAGGVIGKVARGALGPAGAVAAAVLEPQPAGPKMSEFERQDMMKKGINPFKSQGRSIDQYEKDVLTPKKSEPNKTADVPTPPSRPDYFTRGQAFSAARKEAGGGEGKFSYQSGSDDAPKTYQTNVKSKNEPYKPEAQLKQTSVNEETKMDTKELVNEALDNILENNLVDMKENFLAALQEKAMEKLEEKRKEIASSYFAQ